MSAKVKCFVCGWFGFVGRGERCVRCNHRVYPMGRSK